MADIFLSYKREDVRSAKAITVALRAARFSVFFDEMIPVGDMWDWKIERELNGAKAIVPVWTPRSVESKWVRLEAHEGENRSILAPILLEECIVPLAFRLTEAADLRAWKPGDTKHPEWSNLVATLTRLAGPRGAHTRPKRKSPAKSSGGQLQLPLEVPVLAPSNDNAWKVFCRSARSGFRPASTEDFVQYRVAASQGMAWAQYMFGVMHLLGRGAAEDPVEAMRWLERAAAGGYYAADYALGLIFEFGVGTRSNTRRARR